jgi:hypothetical protein
MGVRASLRTLRLISRTLKLTRAYFFFITLCCQAMLEYIVALVTKQYGIWKYGDITKQNRMELRHPSSSASDTVKWSSSEIKDSAVYCMKCHLARCVWVNFSVWLFAGYFGFDIDRNWKANIRLVTKLPSGIFMKPETKCNQLFLSHFYKFWFFQKLGICSTLHVWASEAAHHPSNTLTFFEQ